MAPNSSGGASIGPILASGTFQLPAAQAFGQPGFHEVLTATAELPADLGSGRTLVLALRDATRTYQLCGSEHPLSGCATVDWSDAESRPRVPPGGVFDNSVTLGSSTLFLRASGALATAKEPFDPG